MPGQGLILCIIHFRQKSSHAKPGVGQVELILLSGLIGLPLGKLLKLIIPGFCFTKKSYPLIMNKLKKDWAVIVV
jgi:hypothetical protein